jgi:hypothetical protein
LFGCGRSENCRFCRALSLSDKIIRILVLDPHSAITCGAPVIQSFPLVNTRPFFQVLNHFRCVLTVTSSYHNAPRRNDHLSGIRTAHVMLRRSHKKSRAGCLECKRRHVKVCLCRVSTIPRFPTTHSLLFSAPVLVQQFCL